MQEKVVTLDWHYKKEYQYLINSAKAKGLLYGYDYRAGRWEVYVAVREESEDEILSALCEEVLLTSLKWRYFEPFVGKYFKTPEDKALIFSLLDFDSKAERLFFKEKIYQGNEIHIDAYFNFRLANVKKVWDGYIELITDFYAHKPELPEKLELTAYMLTVNRRCRDKRLGRFFVFDNVQDEYLQKIFYYHEKIGIIPPSCEEESKIVKKIFG